MSDHAGKPVGNGMVSSDGPAVQFSPATLAVARRIMGRYPEAQVKSALLPLLHLAQMEFGGWLSVQAMTCVAELLQIKQIEVFEVASFYSMFNLKPVGKCVLEVCRTGPCWLLGAEDIVRHAEKRLGIKAGETSADGMFTLKTVECLAACGTAPVMQVGETYHEQLTCEKLDEILDGYKKRGEVVTHWDKKHVGGRLG
jgi:NADH-quinone oxidoreductase subunit E